MIKLFWFWLLIVLLTILGCRGQEKPITEALDYNIIIDTIFSNYSSLKKSYPSMNLDSTLFYSEMDEVFVLKLTLTNNSLDSICPMIYSIDSSFIKPSSIRMKERMNSDNPVWSISLLDNFFEKSSCVFRGQTGVFYSSWDYSDFNEDSVVIRFATIYPEPYIEMNLDSLMPPNN